MRGGQGRRSRITAMAMAIATAMLVPAAGRAFTDPAATPPVVNVGSASVVEGDSGARTMYVPVTLSRPSTTPVTVDYLVVADTAAAGSDFNLISKRLTFAVNNTTGLTATVKLIPVTVYGDRAIESDETIAVRLWGPVGAVLGTSVAKSTIVNDDLGRGIRVGVGDVSIDRSDIGATAVIRAMVTLSRPSASTVSVQYAVTSTGTAGVDYSARATGITTFASGAVTRYVGISIYSSDRSAFAVTVKLSAPVGATIFRATGSIRVVPAAPAAPAVAPSILWGAWIGKQFTSMQAPWSMSAVTTFESKVGKQVSLIHFSSPFANCASSPCSFYKFDSIAFDNVQAHGSIPFFSWASGSLPASANEPNFQLADVIAGTYDSYITTWAAAAKAWGHTFLLRFDWEMNGSWFPWSATANGNKPGEYVAAWQHVHQLFTNAGATNVSWVWCPNIDPRSSLTPISSLYPGDTYVDWTCLDGYNWGTNTAGHQSGWQTFDQIYHSTYHNIVDTIAPAKPMVIGEVGSTEYGGSKAAWISDMLTVQLPQNFPNVGAVMWFEKGGGEGDNMDWPIESSLLSQSAFANGIADPSFAANTFASRSTLPILPP